jgi:hypothetical protein
MATDQLGQILHISRRSVPYHPLLVVDRWACGEFQSDLDAVMSYDLSKSTLAGQRGDAQTKDERASDPSGQHHQHHHSKYMQDGKVSQHTGPAYPAHQAIPSDTSQFSIPLSVTLEA